MEFVPVIAIARYRLCREEAGGTPGNGPPGAATECDPTTLTQGEGDGDPLDITAGADTFDTLGPVQGVSSIDESTAGAACAVGGATCLAINNADGEIYDGHDISPVVAAASDALAHDSGSDISPFATDGDGHSPIQRVSGFNTVVSYVCDPVGGSLRRYEGYGLQSVQPGPPAGGSVLVADDVVGCDSEYTAGGAVAGNGVIQFGLLMAGADTELALMRQVGLSLPL